LEFAKFDSNISKFLLVFFSKTDKYIYILSGRIQPCNCKFAIAAKLSSKASCDQWVDLLAGDFTIRKFEDIMWADDGNLG
jgi:hypothetical protein